MSVHGPSVGIDGISSKGVPNRVIGTSAAMAVGKRLAQEGGPRHLPRRHFLPRQPLLSPPSFSYTPHTPRRNASCEEQKGCIYGYWILGIFRALGEFV